MVILHTHIPMFSHSLASCLRPNELAKMIMDKPGYKTNMSAHERVPSAFLIILMSVLGSLA